MSQSERRADLVVVGAGVAGLTAALCAAEQGLDVVVCNKGPCWDPERVEQPTATFYAQGGVAVVSPDNSADSVDLHLHDTIAAGAGLTDADAAYPILADGWSAVSRLIGRGARFDRDESGMLLRTREGGHSVRRIIHAGGDATGAQIQRALGAAATEAARRLRFECLDETTVTRVLTVNGRVAGIVHQNTTGRGVIFAPTVLLATGGGGHLFAATTNPPGSSADGVALALRAGAEVADLEFMQFHPTMLYTPGARGRRTLVTEAIRGEGGRLVDADGGSVTAGLHPLGDLAPRDVVANAVQAAIDRSGAPCVYLDTSGIDDFERRFPTVTAGMRRAGLDPAARRIPVVPGAHYQCGGVVTDVYGRTSVVGLLAAGEVARTGLHGGNRLASNSLLEGLVMGERAAAVAVDRRDEPVSERSCDTAEDVVAPALDRRALQDAMSAQVGLRRDAEGLLWVARMLAGAPDRVLADTADFEGAALCLAATAVVAAAAARTETRGCHVRTDHPQTAPGESGSAIFRMVDLEIRKVATPAPI
ncbi:MAG: L-aspartate oxidase [Gordonia sp. (in: high G+C Gram-positive bacteria)]